jgi:predicted nucleic-acid-binding protein/bifunctional DNA-binding transcriptional regulator/antitoxin component of YhaV-PrlF toxin-antitoxin module
MAMIQTATMTNDGRIEVPKPVQDALGVGPGSQIAFEIRGDGTVMVHADPMTRPDLLSLRGVLEADGSRGHGRGHERHHPGDREPRMIALDTNVLVRFLVEDDAAQASRAAALIEQAIADGTALFISDVVLCETVWVLTARYGFSRVEVAAVLRRLLDADHLVFATPPQNVRALAAYAAGKDDFADYVIREHGRAAACSAVATFDHALLKETGYVSP